MAYPYVCYSIMAVMENVCSGEGDVFNSLVVKVSSYLVINIMKNGEKPNEEKRNM